MRSKTIVLPVFLVIFCASAAASSDAWVEVRRDHFAVLTDSSEKQARHILEQFETMRWMFQTLFPSVNVDPVAPIVVVAAKNSKTFETLEPAAYLASGQLKLGGLFMRAPDKNYVLLRLDAEQDQHPYATIYHEYTHLQFSGDTEWMPIWLNEGIAEFVQNREVRNKEVVIGEPSPEDILYLRQNHTIPLPVLFKVDAKSPYYHEEQKGSVFYAESWALTHFLFISDKQKGTNRLGMYWSLLSRYVDPVVAAQQAFGDLGDLEGALNEYITRRIYLHLTLSSAAARIDESTFKATPLTETEANAARADVLAYIQRGKEARELLETVLKSDPKNAEAHETLAFLAFHDGHREEAEKEYGKAVELGSRNYLAYYYHASLALSQPEGQRDKQAEEDLRTAVKLNPRFAPASEQLATVLWAQGHAADAEAVLETLAKSAVSSREAAVARRRIAEIERNSTRFEGSNRPQLSVEFGVAQRAALPVASPAAPRSDRRPSGCEMQVPVGD